MACVGCGYCCIRNTCAFGVALHPDAGDRNCPELEWTGSRYVCRLMAPSHPLADFYRHELQSGGGCRSFNNPWRQEVRQRTSEEARAVTGGTLARSEDKEGRGQSDHVFPTQGMGGKRAKMAGIIPSPPRLLGRMELRHRPQVAHPCLPFPGKGKVSSLPMRGLKLTVASFLGVAGR